MDERQQADAYRMMQAQVCLEAYEERFGTAAESVGDVYTALASGMLGNVPLSDGVIDVAAWRESHDERADYGGDISAELLRWLRGTQ